MKRLLLFPLLLLLLTPCGVNARLPKLKRAKAASDTVVTGDTITASTASISLAGYDKPNSATRETFFVTNNLRGDSLLLWFEVELTYTDMAGRMLHKRVVAKSCSIPSGETRLIEVSSWDRNNNFHYHRSTPPLRRASSPYRVASRPLRLLSGKQ